MLRAHSSASALLIGSEKLGQSHWDVTEVALEVLRSAGFDPVHASEIAGTALVDRLVTGDERTWV